MRVLDRELQGFWEMDFLFGLGIKIKAKEKG
jgi:hypothetical protein